MDLSVVIPARKEQYLQQTIDSILKAARGTIEVIAVLDGYWPNPSIKDDPRVHLIHFPEPRGMRTAINAGAKLAKGEYLMKCDAHCIFADGFDEALKADCKPDYTLVPTRYSLDSNKWERKINKKYEFEYISSDQLKGKRWPEFAKRVEGKKLCDLMTSQGSCWFMRWERFWDLGGLDDINYGSMGREAQEVCLKSWLSGGRYVLDRNTWYAHWSKSRSDPRFAHRDEKQKSIEFATDLWMNDKWPLAKRKLKWLVKRFAPVPTWDTPGTSLTQYTRTIHPTILDTKGKFIFFGIRKNCLCSIQLETLKDRIIKDKWRSQWKKQMAKADINKVFKFTIVRNPWDRMVSSFHYLQQGLHRISEKETFKHYVKTTFKKHGINRDSHFEYQYPHFYFNGKIFVDFIARLENIKEDWAKIAGIIGCDPVLAHINQSKHDHYRAYYDDECREIVGNVYKKDIELLGYKFE